MKKTVISIIIGILIQTAIFNGCIEQLPIDRSTYITTSSGNIFNPTDDGLQLAINDLAITNGGTITLPPTSIEIDKMFYITQSNMNIIGSSSGKNRTTLEFTNHTVWYDSNPLVTGWRAVRPDYPNSTADRFADFSMKSMDFYKCKNIYLENIIFTGAANIRFVIEQNANIHLKNVDFIYIDRPFTHHTDYGSWKSCPSFELDYGTTIGGGVLIEYCDIYQSTNWGWVPLVHSNATVEDFIFRNCTAYRCGMPVNGIEIVESYNINGTIVIENNNWQNWSIGFGIAEPYWSQTQIIPTSRNFLFDNCTSEENRESGFHSEWSTIKDNIVFINCKSNRNGQKWFSKGYSLGYNPSLETYSSGFLNYPDKRYQVNLINCSAISNFCYGFYGIGYNTQLINCIAIGNGIKDFY